MSLLGNISKRVGFLVKGGCSGGHGFHTAVKNLLMVGSSCNSGNLPNTQQQGATIATSIPHAGCLSLNLARPYSLLTHRESSVASLASPLPVTIQSRNICGRENCADPCNWPPCDEYNLKRKPDCAVRTNIYAHYWEEKNEICCKDPCRYAFPRFDDLYYQENDKENRIYTQTWVECPPLQIKPKKICCYEQSLPPIYCKRARKERPKTACEIVPPCRKLERETDCPRIKSPCCCPNRVPPKCHKSKTPLNCKKFCAPYPSYSECMRDRPRPKHPVECMCLHEITMCEYFNWLRNLEQQPKKQSICPF